MKTVACIVVQSPRAFNWLGHMPVMNWSLNQLLEVRGIDRIVCVAQDGLAHQAEKLLMHAEIETTSIPEQVKGEVALDKWLCAANGPAADADIVTVLKPTTPFLPAAKIEECLRKVRQGRCAYCLPARSVPAQTTTAAERANVFTTLDSLRVFAVQTLSEPGTKPSTVSVSLIEALDVSQPDDSRIANALVLSGSI